MTETTPLSERPPLTPAELARAINQLEIENKELARLLGVDMKTLWRWVEGQVAVPRYASLIVRLLLARPELKAVIGVRQKSGRGRPPKSRT